MIANTYSYGYVVAKAIILWGEGSGGTRWRSWLRQCATNWKVAGSISDGMSEIFHCPNPSGHTMVDSASKAAGA
jgi:hypothetical protein